MPYTEDELVKALCDIHEYMADMRRQGDEWASEFFGEGDWARLVPAHIRESLNLSPDEVED
jgi:hypothetical protein